MAVKMTKTEANMLIDMLKKYVHKNALTFPASKGKLVFDVIGERRTDVFTVNIDRKGINKQACSYQGRIKSNDIILLRLDVNPTAIHVNPSDGKKITGSHLHIYTEEYEMNEAILFNTNDKDIYDLCFTFFERFHIIEPPVITYQLLLPS